MTKIIELNTDRLRLRQWQESDLPAFAELNSDPRVMEYYPNLLSLKESTDMANRVRDLIDAHGWGFWAVEEIKNHQFLGFVGLHIPSADLPFSPCVEIGWRLAYPYWGKGYATEAAGAALKAGFGILGMDEIVSFTSTENKRSRAVMERLGMRDSGENFQHPAIPESSRLREQCLYRLSKSDWMGYK